MRAFLFRHFEFIKHMLGLYVRVPLERFPAGVPRNQRHLGDGQTGLKQPADAFVPQVVQGDVFQLQELGRTLE